MPGTAANATGYERRVSLLLFRPSRPNSGSAGYRGAMNSDLPTVARRHLRLGWLGLAAFVVLGIVLEALHAFKVPLYLDVGNETRRLMWTLAHAHGTLLSLVQLAVASTAALLGSEVVSDGASKALLVGWVMLPLGFFLGGIGTFGGDPGPGVFLAPVGALATVLGMGLVARQVWSVTRGA